MAAAFGTLIERLIGAQVYFAPDGSLIGSSSAAISNVIAPATPATTMLDYNLGRVNTAKYDPKTKDRVREWAVSTGGYKERTDKVIVADAFDFTVIEYAPQLVDQLMFGTAALAAAGAVQPFVNALRQKDGWLYFRRINEAATAISLLLLHSRLTLATIPDDKNEPGSLVFRCVALADSSLDLITFAVG